MPRAKRFEQENGWYHVVNRGAARRHIFFSDELKLLFLKCLERTSIKYEFDVYAFCIMGNHYHLLINTKMPNLSDGMRYLNSRFARYYNYTRRKDGPIFKSRFRSTYISSYNYLRNVSRYIHWNPVSARIVKQPEDYNWSSYWDHANECSRFLCLNTSLFSKSNSFVSYIRRGVDQRTSEFYKKERRFSKM